MKHLFFNKALRAMLIADGIVSLAAAMLGPIYAFFVEEVGGDILDAGLTSFVFFFTAGITTLVAGKYADKIKENELIIVFGYAMMGIGFLMYLLVDTIMFLFLVMVVTGFADAIYAPAFDSIYSKHCTRRKSGLQWGAWEAINYFTVAIAAAVGGIVVTLFGFNILFIAMAVLSFSSAIYIYVLPRKLL